MVGGAHCVTQLLFFIGSNGLRLCTGLVLAFNCELICAALDLL